MTGETMAKKIANDVGQMVKQGLKVYDDAGDKIGYVDSASGTQGWMQVGLGELELRKLWVPYRLVKSVDPREVFVSATGEELQLRYGQPPERQTHVEHRDGKTIAVTTEPSGYDDSAVVTSEVDLDHVRQLLAVDQRVWTSDNVEIGRIKEFDDTMGYAVIEKGILSRAHALVIPIHLVGEVDRDAGSVTLAVSESDLTRMRHLKPADVVIGLPDTPGY